MTTYNVTVLEHRRHVIAVEANDEDEAIEAVQQQIFGKTVDLTHGETTLVEAVEVEEAHPEAEHAAEWKKVGDAVFDHEQQARDILARAHNGDERAAVSIAQAISLEPGNRTGWQIALAAIAEREVVHADFRAAGFKEEWTGGNCQAWLKNLTDHSLWISDEGAGLGDTSDEQYALAVTELEGSFDLAVATGTQPEILALAVEAQADPAAFIAKHPL